MYLPKEWEEQGKKFIQYVSPEKATREQAKDLFKALDEKIKERQAREKGICPVRDELYAQCFDEIIRQVTTECPERGLLLLRVRDEIRMTIASYQTLYESSILFGIRKQLQAESGKEELKNRLKDLEKQKVDLSNRVKLFFHFLEKST
jgi:dynein light intermediate chain